MKKPSDRIKIWREKQKAEGKTSITVLLSHEARAILAEEKEKTGESYSVIVENALQSLSETPRGKPRGIFNSKEGDCIPLTPAPHSSPPLMAGYSAGKFHKSFIWQN